MANLRILFSRAVDSSNLMVQFSANVRTDLVTGNVSIVSLESGSPDPKVLSISVFEDIVTIVTTPMTPFSKYKAVFQSTNTIRFNSDNATQFLLENGNDNVVPFVSSEDPANEIRNLLVTDLKDNVYNLTNGTVVRNILNGISEQLSEARYLARQTKTANYLTYLVKDEKKTRGFGPWDRLLVEGAYDVIRVSTSPTNATTPGVIYFDSFPRGPISLQSVSITSEKLKLGVGASTYDGLILTVNQYPVIKVTKIQIQYSNGNIYDYNIQSNGYQLNDATYDATYARRYVTLGTNQIKLSDDLLDDPLFVLPGGTDIIVVNYDYKHLGKKIDENSVTVSEVMEAIREPAPAQSNQFSLVNAPVVTSSDTIPTSGGIEFLDPYSTTPFQTVHPAFLKEIPYRAGSQPQRAGEYSVDYSTGKVYVYGSSTSDGTGSFPPAMNYNYRKTYVPKLDYTYVPDTYNLVASPLRDLATQAAKISFNFEMVLVPGVDYNAGVHVESRNERIHNRLFTTACLTTEHAPITNVFRVYNETSGEVYQVSRFYKNKVYFNYKHAPTILGATRERVSFTDVISESLIIDKEITNVLSTRVLRIKLINKDIVASTEDCIGSSFNSSVNFSRADIFNTEVYYDDQELTETTNINRLTVGQYQVNYRDGLVYVGVTPTQSASLGTVSYKNSIINPSNPHVISVSNIYNSLSQNSGVTRTFDYSSFGEASIVPINLDFSDERFTNADVSQPYFLNGNTIAVTNDIKDVRSIFDAYNLNNSETPINFGSACSWNANIITMDSIGETLTSTATVSPTLTITMPFLSPGISLNTVISVVRHSDSKQLIDGYQTISGNVVTLSGTSGAVSGDVVTMVYTVILNGASTPIVDYNKGDFFVDYTYLADEILVTYEYGDNVIDFRESTTLSPNQNYYVTYRVGALRDSLLNNFGSLVKIKELEAFDEDIDREIYRDALMGALQTFTKGPTIPAMKQLVSFITKIEPQIIEALFDEWSLSYSYLNKETVKMFGEPQLVAGKYDSGLSFVNKGDAVSLPVSNNLRLEEGTLELFVKPEWDGLDNDASLTFSIQKDGYGLDPYSIYIGSASYNPKLDQGGKFTINRNDDKTPIGLPSAVFTRTGVFIYYDPDNRKWKVLAKDKPTAVPATYSGTLESSGIFYDVKFIPGLGELSDMLRSGGKKVEFRFNIDAYEVIDGYDGYDGYDAYSVIPGYSFDGIQFMSDDDHYIFDFAEERDRNRFSLYKDGRGYLVFEIWDRGGYDYLNKKRRNRYQVSADIQNWKAGQEHHVALSWAINSQDRRDEMHLFVDGLETPNIARYGNIPSIVSTNRFRTVVPEQVIGTVPNKSITGNNLVTTQGSNFVTSVTNFAGINIGDTIEIMEQGFSTYTINSVGINSLTLSSTMPATLSNARFSINPVSFIVGTEIDVYKRIGVFIYSGGQETELPGMLAEIPAYTITRNALNQRILKVLGDVDAGDQLIIKTFGLNHRRCRESVYLWGDNQSLLKTQLPPPINLDDVIIRNIVLPLVPIGPANATLSLGNWNATLSSGQPTNSTEGRHLTIRVTGDNTNFSTPTTVTINGTSTGPATEVLTFTSASSQNTLNKWKTITSVVVVTKPIVASKNGLSVEVKETYSATYADGNSVYPVIRFAYKTQFGLTLSGDGGDIITDASGFFPASLVGNILNITAPPSVVGNYTITEKIDNTTVRVTPALGTAFTNGTYGAYNISIGRSGFQNGFMFLEIAGVTNAPYPLPKGTYEFDYATYLEVPFDPVYQDFYVGNDFALNHPVRATLDEMRILNMKISDTRVGETISVNQESITANAISFAPFVKNKDTLVLLHFDQTPPINDCDYYTFAKKEYVQSGQSVNSRFGHSVVIKDKGLSFENQGNVNTASEGMIEFWVSPRFDTYNDPVPRIYFDATTSVFEDVVSTTNAIVSVGGLIGRVISVKLANDPDGTDYFAGGKIGSDRQTITLNTPLPYQRTAVRVSYIPSGVSGDRITILKDEKGYISLNVSASGNDFEVKQPVFWPRDTWHRIRASYKFNRSDNRDELRLFVDGEEQGIITWGSGLLFGQGAVFGQSAVGVSNKVLVTDINFKDTITQFSIGQDYLGYRGAQARIDNFKISNKSIVPFTIAGQPMDVYYNTNVDFIYPSITDAYTTFLMDFDQLIQKVEDFAIIRDSMSGLFNFTLNIIDSFDIALGDPKVKTILEAMINTLKPATSKVLINYVK